MKTLRICCLLAVMALAAAVAPGCSDRQVSLATINLANSLTAISQDLQADSTGYLSRFQEQRLVELKMIEEITLERLDASGQLTAEVQAEVEKAFAAKRVELGKNVDAARAAYRLRVEALQTAAQIAVEVDGYYRDRNYNVFRAIGVGAIQGLLDQTGSLQTLLGGIRTTPLPGGELE